MSVPNRVWDAMGSPCLTYLASNDSSGGPSWFYLLNPVCVQGLDPLVVLKQPGPAGTWFLCWSTLGSSRAAHIVWVVPPPASSRKRPIRELGQLFDWVSTHRGPPGFSSWLV